MSLELGEETVRGKKISYEDFLAVLKHRGLHIAKEEKTEEKIVQVFHDNTGKRIGEIWFRVLRDGTKTRFFALAYVKRSNESNVLESAWLGFGLNPYMVEAIGI